MSVAYTPEILVWARKRAGIDEASIFAVNKKYTDWELGKARPTFKQAQTLAKKLRIPFGYLYLSKPPVEKQYTADLRGSL
jgi:hypothetical protein